ncbi:MAG: nucleotidyltransferase substrate binding protein [Bacteroidales bacterium]|nr:nucleotidyltransferase substrate binding protein [Bacteroidales bacterium]
MTGSEDTRWKQRFSNYKKAMDKLSEAVDFVKKVMPDQGMGNFPPGYEVVQVEVLREGLIQRFEFTHELAWNVMKDFLEEVGEVKIYGSKDATREAFKAELVEDGDVWMEMIKSRNLSSHTYNEEIANEIYSKIMNDYYAALLTFRKMMEAKESGK